MQFSEGEEEEEEEFSSSVDAVSLSVYTFLIPSTPPFLPSPLSLPPLPPHPTLHVTDVAACNKSDTPKTLVCLLCLVNVLYVNCNLGIYSDSSTVRY